jgi:hypothetical protein
MPLTMDNSPDLLSVIKYEINIHDVRIVKLVGKMITPHGPEAKEGYARVANPTFAFPTSKAV